jgi:hypothetical protein
VHHFDYIQTKWPIYEIVFLNELCWWLIDCFPPPSTMLQLHVLLAKCFRSTPLLVGVFSLLRSLEWT